MWAGRFDDAAISLDQGAGVTGDAWEWAYSVGCHALLEAVRGRLGSADKLAHSAAAPWNGHAGAARRPSAPAEVALAWVDLERNKLNDAHARLSQAEDALRAQPDRLIGALAWLVLAYYNLATGRAGTVAEIVGRAGQGWSPPPWLAERLALTLSRARAALGDIEGALDAAGRAGPPSSVMGAVALARALLAANDPTAAASALASMSPAPAADTPPPIEVEARLLEAELGYSNGRPDRGRQSLKRALKLAETNRLLLPIALQWAWIKPLLRGDAALAATVEGLFEAAHDVRGGARAQPPGNGQPAPVFVEKLSGRELEVLRLASKMLTTAEIAEEMYLSVNTVKSHLKSIFRKLGTSHRGEAVRMAHRLALL
jgi:LuxR family maltose regulon positive regulatory protein